MIKQKLQQLTKHKFVELTSRGNTAIEAALSNLKGKILIPEEGGWLSYKTLPEKLGLESVKVKCDNAVLNLQDLSEKVKTASALLYQNPGGYHGEQPMQEIYNLCKQNNCLVILDVSGSIGTELCDGNYADIIIGSFGKWKLVDVGIGGFISWNDETMQFSVKPFTGDEKLILDKLENLSERIKFLQEKRKQVISDLENFEVINKNDTGIVVIVLFKTADEKEKIINYCVKSNLEYTECPRYIRLNKEAISIEVKRK